MACAAGKARREKWQLTLPARPASVFPAAPEGSASVLLAEVKAGLLAPVLTAAAFTEPSFNTCVDQYGFLFILRPDAMAMGRPG